MKCKKRRGITEIIATLLLLAITTTGSVFLAYIVQGSGLGSVSNPLKSSIPTYALQLTGYDTRDGADLMDLGTLDNKQDNHLCTTSCGTDADNIPTDANPGTEFISIHIKNVSPESVFLKNIQVNGITHQWDEQTGGKTFDASANDVTGKYPLSGKYSILPGSGLVQKSDNKLSDDEDVLLIVKLSKDITSDISLSKPIQVSVNFGSTRASEFVILSGDTK